MKWDAVKRCEFCGRCFDGDTCPECGRYATEYQTPETDEAYKVNQENQEEQGENEDDKAD